MVKNNGFQSANHTYIFLFKLKMVKLKRIFEVVFLIVIVAGFFGILFVKYYGNLDMKNIGINNFETKQKMVNGYVLDEVLNEHNKDILSLSEIVIAEPDEKKNTRTVPVLVYHGITPKANGEDITIENFKDQMVTLKKNGYETVSLRELQLFINGEIELPEKSFLITFDDGRKDSYYFTDDILEALDYEAVMFIVTAYSLNERDHPYYLNKDEVIEMMNSGRWEIQSHSHAGHSKIIIDENGNTGSYFGNKKWIEEEKRIESDAEYKNRIYNDLEKSNKLLKEELGINVTSFAIPYSDFGQYDSNIAYADLINREIYPDFFNMVFYQYKPIRDKDFRSNYNDEVGEDFHFVMRITVELKTSGEKLVEILQATEEKDLPYTENFDNHNNWVRSWGNHVFLDNNLVMVNDEKSTSSLAYLDGSYLWEDYVFNVNVNKNTGDSVMLVSRFANVDNYVSCNFEDGYVQIDVVRDGFSIDSKKVKVNSLNIKRPGNELGILVEGDVAKCYIGNNSVAAIDSNQIPNHGGIAFKTWIEKSSKKGYTQFSDIAVSKISD